MEEGRTNRWGEYRFEDYAQGEYHLELYRDGPWGQEYWVNDQASILDFRTTYHDLTRNEPFTSSLRVYDGSRDVTGGVVELGTDLRWEAVVRNDSPVDRRVWETLFVDRDQGGSYDFTASDIEWVYDESQRTFSFHWTPDEAGTYFQAVTTETEVNSRWVLTDGWDWGRAVTVEESVGDLRVTLRNWDGGAVAGGEIELYEDDWTRLGRKTTNSQGQATWNDLEEGWYRLEGYKEGPWGREYWVNDRVWVEGGELTTIDLTRNEPFTSSLRVYDGSREVTGDVVELGTELRWEAVVRNDSPIDRRVLETLFIDRDQGGSYDFTASDIEWVYDESQRTFSFHWTPDEAGTYFQAVTTETELNSRWVLTDGWDWGEAVTVEPSAPIAEIIGFEFPLGPIERATNQTTTVTFRSNESFEEDYWVGLSFAHESASLDDWPLAWYDIEPIPVEDMATGEERTVEFEFQIPENLEAGQYFARASIWDDYDDTTYLMVDRIDDTLNYEQWRDRETGATSFSLASFNAFGEVISFIEQHQAILELLGFDNDWLATNGRYRNGEKPLFNLTVRAAGDELFGIPLEASASLLVDLADLFQVTPEGRDGWVTAWLDASAAIGYDIETLPTPVTVDFGIVTHDFDFAERAIADYRRYATGNAGVINLPGFTFTAASWNDRDGFRGPRFEWNGTAAMGFRLVEGDLSGLISFEVNWETLLHAFVASEAANLSEYVEDVTGNLLAIEPGQVLRTGTADDGDWELYDGQRVSGLALTDRFAWNRDDRFGHYFVIEVPENASRLQIDLVNGVLGVGDADLYIRRGARPGIDPGEFDYCSRNSGNMESITVDSPVAGSWHIVVPTHSEYADVDLVARYDLIDPQPEIDVVLGGLFDIHSFDFGAVALGDEREVVFSIRNEGSAGLRVSHASGLATPFRVEPTNGAGGEDDWIIAPNEVFQMLVRFAPSVANQFGDVLTLVNNDPDEGEYEIAFSGSGEQTLFAEIDIERDGQSNVHNHEFEAVVVGEAVRQEFVVRNLGTAVLTVSSASGLTSPFRIDPVNGTGSGDDWIVQPGDSRSFEVWFAPLEGDQFTSTLIVRSNDDDESSYEIDFSGEGVRSNRQPTIGDFFPDSTIRQWNEQLLLTADGIADPDGDELTVYFYRDDGDRQLDDDDILLTPIDFDPVTGIATWSGEVDRGWGSGERMLFAVAEDEWGARSDTKEITIEIIPTDDWFEHDDDYSVGANPRSVVSADFNQDGLNDLAISSSGDDSVTILLNDTSEPGRFVSAFPAIRLGDKPWALVTADFNGDGVADLAVTNEFDGTVQVLLNRNDGSGEMDALAALTLGSVVSPRSMTAADFDRDGDIDLAVAGYEDSGENLVTLLNDGGARFARSAANRVGAMPISVEAGDVDGNGWIDLVTADHQGAQVSVLLNFGGAFAAPVAYQVRSPGGSLHDPRDLTLGDLDSDGYLDIAVSLSDADAVLVFMNQGAGIFEVSGEPVSLGVGSTPREIATDDLDGDGDLDLVVSSWQDNQTSDISILAGHGDGRLSAPISLGASGDPLGLALSDLDNDGDVDLAATLFGLDQVGVWLNRTETYSNRLPRIAYMEASPERIYRGESVTLTAHGIFDPDSLLVHVDFYLDSAGDGIFNEGVDFSLGQGSSVGRGVWSLEISDTGEFRDGLNHVFARVSDEAGGQSIVVFDTVTLVPNQPPIVTDLTADPGNLRNGERFTLIATASDPDPDGAVALVEFYHDDGDEVFEPGGDDELIGVDSSASGGWSWSGVARFDLGLNRFFARAQDDDGAWSDEPGELVVVVDPELFGGDPTLTLFDHDGDEVTIKLSGDRDGVLWYTAATAPGRLFDDLFVDGTDGSGKIKASIRQISAGDGRATIGAVYGSDGESSVTAKTIDLSALDLDGVGIVIDGVKSLKLGDLTASASIVGTASKITLGSVNQSAALDLGWVDKFVADSIDSSGLFRADYLAKLDVKGDSAFDLRLDGDTSSELIKKLRVRGSLSGTWIIAGAVTVNKVQVDGVTSLTLREESQPTTVKKVMLKDSGDSRLDTDLTTVSQIKVSGSLSGSTLEAATIEKVKINGRMSDSTIRTDDSIQQIILGEMRDVAIGLGLRDWNGSEIPSDWTGWRSSRLEKLQVKGHSSGHNRIVGQEMNKILLGTVGSESGDLLQLRARSAELLKMTLPTGESIKWRGDEIFDESLSYLDFEKVW
ncbi:MAG: FG-GAP-like repeat-containing protein [Phycisphaerales bacterium]